MSITSKNLTRALTALDCITSKGGESNDLVSESSKERRGRTGRGRKKGDCGTQGGKKKKKSAALRSGVKCRGARSTCRLLVSGRER